MERTNIRNVTPEDIGSLLDFASIDVAFISLQKVLPVAYTLLKDDGELVALIKPQFEVGREHIGKGGIVRDDALRSFYCLPRPAPPDCANDPNPDRPDSRHQPADRNAEVCGIG